MKDKIKVLHLLESSQFSGAENIVCQIFELLKDLDFEMAYSSRDGQIREALRERNIPFYPMKKLTVLEARRVVGEFKPDIIHAHDIKAGAVASLVGGRAKLISHMHVNNDRMKKLNARSFAYLACSPRFSEILWVSKSSLENYRFYNMVLPKSTVLYNVLDAKQVLEKAERANEAQAFDVVFIGRMVAQKNPGKLMRVLRLAADSVPQIRAAVIGNGELLDQTKQLAAELNLDKNVSFLGFVNNPLAILGNAKVLLMTSRFEGTPICALEAMILGIPIVSTPVDGLKDLVNDGENGFLAEEDEDMAARISALIKDSETRDRMSRSAQAKIAAYNRISEYKDRLIKAYSI